MQTIVDNWWAFVFRGIVAILFGVLTFLMPGMALLTLVFLYGFYAMADGIFNIIAAFRRNGSSGPPWWALLISGVFGLIAGLIAFFLPGITALVLLYLIAAWAVVTGTMSIVAAIRLRKQIRGEWVLALSGVLSIIFGVLLAVFPGPGALAVVLWIGAYAIVFGVLLIVLGFKLRKIKRAVTADAHHHDFPPGVAPSH
jgi:uncharacterized membrane protein HdeD (DUF308 family)